jgi:hypothetical protein
VHDTAQLGCSTCVDLVICCCLLPCTCANCSQARAFAKARSSGRLNAFTSAVANAISDAPDQDAVVEVSRRHYPCWSRCVECMTDCDS